MTNDNSWRPSKYTVRKLRNEFLEHLELLKATAIKIGADDLLRDIEEMKNELEEQNK